MRPTASIASGSPLYGRITPSASTVRPSSCRAGSLRKAGWGMTRSLPGPTPNASSVLRPRSLWVTMRSKRPKSRFQVLVWLAVRRGSRSCAVKTSGRRVWSNSPSASGAATHCRWSRSQSARPSRARANGCSRAFTASRTRDELTPLETRYRLSSTVKPSGVRHGSEAEGRREQAHIYAVPHERGGERVVVRRRVGGGIGDHDAHRPSLEAPDFGACSQDREPVASEHAMAASGEAIA